jgi:bisphosphoglycerate-independent phosphoglycerate mutase (AlkP superfamily)
MPASHKTPTVLIVLDGWGYREETQDNAIAKASTPVWDRLWADAPHALISASGEDVGLPSGQMGNSEVGHMSLGSGRVIYQNISRIDEVEEWFHITGQHDFMLRVNISGIQDYQHFLTEKLASLPNISTVQSLMVLNHGHGVHLS